VGKVTVTVRVDDGNGGTDEQTYTLNVVSKVDTIFVVPSDTAVALGDSAQLRAKAVFRDGTTEDVTAQAHWTSSDSSVVAVCQGGLVRAVGKGEAVVAVSLFLRSGRGKVRVISPRLVDISVEPRDTLVAAGRSVRYRATGKFSDGSHTDVTTVATWTSTEVGVASVNSLGLARTFVRGTTYIVASLGTEQDSVRLVVGPPELVGLEVFPADTLSPPGGTVQYRAIGSFSDGNRSAFTDSVDWTTSDTSVAEIGNVPPKGLASLKAPGVIYIVASHPSTGISDSTVLTVTEALPESLWITLDDVPVESLNLALGDTAQLGATVRLSDGQERYATGTAVWYSTDTDVVEVEGGLVMALGTGSAEVVSSVGTVGDTLEVVVVPPEVVSLEVSPEGPVMGVGDSVWFRATGLLSSGDRLDVTSSDSLIWESSNPEVASVSNVPGIKGLTIGLSGGRTEVRAYFLNSLQDTVRSPAEVLTVDNVPPEISPVTVVSRTDSSITLGFATDELSRAELRFGTSPSDADTSSPADLVSPLATGHVVTLGGLSPSTKYYYRVSAVDTLGNRAFCPLDSAVTGAVPDTVPPGFLGGTPTVVSKTDSSATIAISLDEVGTVEVYYTSTTSDTLVQEGEGAGKEFLLSLTSLSPVTTYEYWVRAVDMAGNGTYSGIKEFTTSAVRDTVPPQFIRGPSVDKVTDGAAYISFRLDEPVRAPRIDYGTTPEFGLVRMEDEGRDEYTVVLSNLSDSTTYFFRVSVEDLSGNGPTVGEGSFTTQAVPDTVPPVIRSVVVADVSRTSATLEILGDEPTTGEVQFGVGPDSLSESMSMLRSSRLHREVLTGLSPGTKYFFRVVLEDISGNRSESEVLHFRTRDEDVPLRIVRGPVVDFVDSTSAQVSWETNLSSSSEGEAGRTETLGEVSVVSPGNVISHTVRFTNLSPGTLYYYKVRSVRSEENEVESDIFTFVTPERRDAVPPQLTSGPVVDVETSSAEVRWKTDEPSSFVLMAGRSPGDLSVRVYGPDYELSHSALLTNLSSGTTYYYRIESTDAGGNSRVNPIYGAPPFEFTTSVLPDTVPPVMVEGPFVGYVADDMAIVQWTTDEPANSEVYYRPVGKGAYDFVVDGRFVVGHSIAITGLMAGTAYEYVVISQDPSGNWTSYPSGTPRPKIARMDGRSMAKISLLPGSGGTFRTAERPDTCPPSILEGPTVLSRTETGFLVRWVTDELANSVVEYGEGDLKFRKELAEEVKEHRVVVAGLKPATIYTYRVLSTDPSGNGPTVSSMAAVTTLAERDFSAPRIVSGPELASLADRTAAIVWRTDEPADSRVEYGPDVSYGNVQLDPKHITFHKVVLTNLLPSTVYHFRVSSTDLNGNGPTWSEDFTFRTEPGPDTAPPRITSGPLVEDITDRTATVVWETDELSNSFVFFGLGRSYGLKAVDPAYVLEHRVTLTGLMPDTTYYYSIGSVDRNGNGPSWRMGLTFRTKATPDTVPPVAPSGVRAEVGNGAVLLTWRPNVEKDLVGYNVYRDGVLVASFVPTSAYLDVGLANDVEYSYQITALDRTSNESELSCEVKATPSEDNVPSAPIPLSPRDGSTVCPRPLLRVLNATPIRTRNILTYTFEVATDPEFKDLVTSTSGVSEGKETTSWRVDETLEDGRAYWWRVRANDGIFYGIPSRAMSFTVDRLYPERPGDFDGDMKVGFGDFFLFVDHFGLKAKDPGFDPVYDLTWDGRINFEDFFSFVDYFGLVYSVEKVVSSTHIGKNVDAEVSLEVAEGRILPNAGNLILSLRLKKAHEVKGFGAVLSYNPDVLRFQRVERGDLLKGAPLLLVIERAEDGIVFIADAFTGRKASRGTGVLARVRFKVVGDLKGSTLARIEEVELVDLDLGRNLVEGTSEVRIVPETFMLSQNFPNPFNATTCLEYGLPYDTQVEVEVYNLLGRKVRTLVQGRQKAGFYRVVWDGSDELGRKLASGIYICVMKAGKFIEVRKIVLLK